MSTTSAILKEIARIKNRIEKLEHVYEIENDTSQRQTDPFFSKSINLLVGLERISASLLQRKLLIGYARASRILDELQDAGYVGVGIGSKPRPVLRQFKIADKYEKYYSLLSDSFNNGAIPYKWLLKLYDSSGLNYKLPIVLGINEVAKAQFADLQASSVLLVGGATGSGKTVFLNTLITTLLYRMSPEELRLIIVDPKKSNSWLLYKNIPHLLTDIIFDAEKTLLALKWCHGEMEFRYKKLADAGVRDITEYNKIKETEKIPFLVVLIDELADLMTHSPKQAEEYIIKLSQLARAVGIHLVLSTQRPSKVVLPPMLRANIFTTMAFQVVSKKDSEKLLYMAGAETLRGTGDMLFSPLDKVKPIRIQAPNIEEVEISATAQFITNSVGRTIDRKI